jgi:hypothetical protein
LAAQSFKQIEQLALALPYSGLGKRVRDMVDSASLNAHETIHLERAEVVENFYDLAMRTLESNLCYCEDFEVCQWFAENDVKY